jgi:hypothetical protein
MGIPSGYTSGQVVQAVPTSANLVLLSTTTLSGATTTISAIDQTYNQIYGTISGVTNATGNGIFRCYVNNDTTGHNYVGARWDGSTSAAVSGTNTFWNISANTNIVRTTATNFYSFFMNNYSATASYKNINWSAQWNGGEMFIGTYQHLSNTAITSLVFSNSAGNLSTGTVTLYGIK